VERRNTISSNEILVADYLKMLRSVAMKIFSASHGGEGEKAERCDVLCGASSLARRQWR
jgi:hypothetical protein